MKVSLKNYTLKYIALTLLVIISVWAAIFYTYILEEVYDNVDDGLKDQKIQIVRKAYIDDSILNISEFDFNQFRISQVNASQYRKGNFFRNELFYMEYDEEMEPYRVLETYFIDRNGRHQKLEIRTSTVEEDDFRESLFVALVFLYIFMILSIFIINSMVLKKVWKPFYQTLTNLGKYQFGKDKIPKPTLTPIREFNLLNNEIDKMIERNEQTFQQQKQFIENASHELQTPLAIAINKLEILIENENINGKNRVELSKTKDGLLRLVKLNKSLLMLSRIENNQFGKKEDIVFNNIIKKILDDYEDIMAFKKITFHLTETDTFKTTINPDLAYILISNLFRNAIKYNRAGGTIEVGISENQLSINNTSTLNEPLDKSQIFNRFYKQSQDQTSSGLGLSIAKTIVENHSNLDIDYTFKNNVHTFSLYQQTEY